jgi:hypothetical protein
LNETKSKSKLLKPKPEKLVSANKPKDINKKADNYNGIFMNSGRKEQMD